MAGKGTGGSYRLIRLLRSNLQVKWVKDEGFTDQEATVILSPNNHAKYAGPSMTSSEKVFDSLSKFNVVYSGMDIMKDITNVSLSMFLRGVEPTIASWWLKEVKKYATRATAAAPPKEGDNKPSSPPGGGSPPPGRDGSCPPPTGPPPSDGSDIKHLTVYEHKNLMRAVELLLKNEIEREKKEKIPKKGVTAKLKKNGKGEHGKAENGNGGSNGEHGKGENGNGSNGEGENGTGGNGHGSGGSSGDESSGSDD